VSNLRLAVARRALLAGGTAFALIGSARAQPSGGDPGQIVAIMDRYAAALRSTDVEALVALYTSDGVFIRDDLPAAAGTDALRAAYRQVFATLKLDLAFAIQETEMAGDMAWLRAVSKGRIRTLSRGTEAVASFNELVVFRRQAAGWKIRSYMYASDTPEPGTPQ
jgi:uncharacterized protein (TIGR02246 family)